LLLLAPGPYTHSLGSLPRVLAEQRIVQTTFPCLVVS
jgi:hypothetical protein